MEKLKLGDICKIVTGSTPKTSIAEYWDGNINWITPVELTEDTYIVNDSQRKITNRAIEETGLKSFPKGTVILTSRAPIGKVAIAGKEMYCNQGFKNLICSSKINNKYLYWYLKGHTEYLNSLGRGATFKEISKTIVENIEIPVPDLDTQKNCVDVLEKCNKIIKSYQKQLKSFDTLVKSRFIELFGDPILNPNKWEKNLLGEVCDVRDGTHDSPKYYAEGYPLVTSKNVTSGKIDFKNCNRICKEDYDKINVRSKVDPGDILMPMIGTVGKPVIVDGEVKFAIKNVALIKLKENSKVIQKYVKALLESDYFDRIVISQIRGGTQKFIALGDIRKLKIALPPLKLQEQFADFVARTDKSKHFCEMEVAA